MQILRDELTPHNAPFWKVRTLQESRFNAPDQMTGKGRLLPAAFGPPGSAHGAIEPSSRADPSAYCCPLTCRSQSPLGPAQSGDGTSYWASVVANPRTGARRLRVRRSPRGPDTAAPLRRVPSWTAIANAETSNPAPSLAAYRTRLSDLALFLADLSGRLPVGWGAGHRRIAR